VPLSNEGVELLTGFFELLVLDELVDEFPARIHVVVFAFGRDRVLALREEESAFYLHEGRSHDEEVARDF